MYKRQVCNDSAGSGAPLLTLKLPKKKVRGSLRDGSAWHWPANQRRVLP